MIDMTRRHQSRHLLSKQT